MSDSHATPESTAGQLNQATRLHNAGVVRISEGDLPGAEVFLWDSLKMRTNILGALDPDVGTTLRLLCSVLTAQSKISSAREIAVLLLSIKEQVSGKIHPEVAVEIDRLARLCDLQGDLEKAEELYNRSFLLREQFLKDCHPDLAAALANLGSAYEANGKFEKAEQCYRRLLSSNEELNGSAHAKTVDALERLLRVLTKQRPSDGETSLIKKWSEMAALYHGERRYSEAEVFYRRAIGKIDGTLSRDAAEMYESEQFFDSRDQEPVRPSPERVLKLLKKATE
jgi:tetratricopeptide (TPR) repeat protein